MTEYPDARMAGYSDSPFTARVHSLEDWESSLVEAGPAVDHLILAAPDARAYYAGNDLVQFDRELRRTATLARNAPIPLLRSVAQQAASLSER